MSWSPEFDKLIGALLLLLIGALVTLLLRRDNARAVEIGRLDARQQKLEQISNEALKIANASEGGKLDARTQKLEQILQEVQTVAAAQGVISTALSAREWDRQTRWNKRVDIYLQLLDQVEITKGRVIDVYNAYGEEATNADAEGIVAQKEDEFGKQVVELRKAIARAGLFGDSEVRKALGQYYRMLEEAVNKRATLASHGEGLQKLEYGLGRLQDALVAHLGLIE